MDLPLLILIIRWTYSQEYTGSYTYSVIPTNHLNVSLKTCTWKKASSDQQCALLSKRRSIHFGGLFQDISRGWSVQLKFHFSQFVTQSFHAWITETQHTTRCATHNTLNYPFSTCRISNTWSILLSWNSWMLRELLLMHSFSGPQYCSSSLLLPCQFFFYIVLSECCGLEKTLHMVQFGPMCIGFGSSHSCFTCISSRSNHIEFWELKKRSAIKYSISSSAAIYIQYVVCI